MIRRILMLIGCCLGVAGLSAAQISATKPASGPTAPPPATTASQPARLCAGTVVDAEDKPLAGATVQVYRYDYLDTKPEILAEMTTKEDGTFSFQLRPDERRRFVDGIVAQKAGLAIGFDNWHRPEDPTTGLVVKLGKPGAISGVVVDEAGQPVAGAAVAALLQKVRDPSHYRYLNSGKWTSSRSDAKGEFRIEDLPADAQAYLEVSAEGRATVITLSPRDPYYAVGKTDIRVVLPEEAKVEGTVVDAATSRPVAGVRLRAMREGTRGPFAMTDADGRFSFAKLPPGKLGVALGPRDLVTGAMDWLAEPAIVTAEAGKTAGNVTITVSKGGLVEVTVTDSKTKAPVPRAYVGLAAPEPQRIATGCSTGQDGVARVRVKPGTYQVASAQAMGFVPVDLRSAPSETITVAEGQTARLAVQLQPLPTIRGVVKDKGGKLVAGAGVWIWYGIATITGPDGAFELKVDRSRPGGEGPNEVLARHAERGLAGVIESPQDDKPIEIKLGSAATLLGKVADAEGKPIPNAELRLTRMSGQFGYGFGQMPPPRSDSDGRYEIKGIPPGNYRVSATADGFGEKQEKFSVADGQVEAMEKSFVLPEAKLSISGVVVDMDDRPVAGANVSLYGQGQSHRSVQTDAAGKFTVEKVVSTSVELQANAERQGKRLYGLGVKAKGGDKDVKVVLNWETDETGRIRKIAGEGARRLAGKPLPKLEPLGLKPAAELAEGKRLLVCFFDMDQRPSRRAIQALNEKAAELAKKGVVVVAIEAAGADEKQLRDWASTNKVTLPLGLVAAEKDIVAKTLATWGVAGLPWLILTDDKHVVAVEGLTPEQIDEALTAPTTRPAAGGR